MPLQSQKFSPISKAINLENVSKRNIPAPIKQSENSKKRPNDEEHEGTCVTKLDEVVLGSLGSKFTTTCLALKKMTKNPTKKKKKITESEVQDYELVPRMPKGDWKVNEIERLPTKTVDGRILQNFQSPLVDNSTDELTTVKDVVSETDAQSDLCENMGCNVLKELIASLALEIKADPQQHVGNLKKLQEIYKSSPAVVKKVCLVTFMSVYKDIIPGYRIRQITEEEKKVKISTEVRELRDFEERLVIYYMGYLSTLSSIIRRARKMQTVEELAMEDLALTCASRLLVTAHHFNGFTQLLEIIVGRFGRKNVDASFHQARIAIERLLSEDTQGHSSLKAVEMLVKIVEDKNYNVCPQVINIFLSVRLFDDFVYRASQSVVDNIRRKRKRSYRSKAQRKLDNENKAIAKQLKEAEAVVSKEEREKYQGQMLKLVFRLYFQILQQAQTRSKHLWGPALEGLSRYAHLINMDFFFDILEALQELLTIESIHETDIDYNQLQIDLLCLKTIFVLLINQCNEVKLDMKPFHSHFYRIILATCVDTTLENLVYPPDKYEKADWHQIDCATKFELLLRLIDDVCFKQCDLPQTRLCAIFKRLSSCSLNMTDKSCVSLWVILLRLFQRYPSKIASLLGTEEKVGNGSYLMAIDEPDQSNAQATTLWEFALLRNHYSPKVQESIKQTVSMFSKAG